MALTYHRKGDYLFPNLTIQETEAQIGKYGISNNWHTFPFRRVKAKDMKKFFLKMVANLRLTYADTL